MPPAAGEENGEESQQHVLRRGESLGSIGSGKKDPVVQMEGVYEKLCILDYQESFLRESKPFHRWQFALPPENTSVQFSLFLELCAWLMTETTGDETFFRVDKFDDPNTAVNKLLLALRKLEFGLEFSASKIKQAHGEAVVTVLDFLVTKTIAKKIHWQRPEYIQETEEEAEIDKEADIGAIEDTEIEAEIEDEAIFKEESFSHFNTADLVSGKANTKTDGGIDIYKKEEKEEAYQQRQILKSQIDPIVWQTEVERVGPRLRYSASITAKEWRSHIDQTKEYEIAIHDLIPSTQKQLEILKQRLIDAKEKIMLKENYINKQFDEKKKSYQTLKTELDTIETSLQTSTENCNNLTNDLGQITDQLEEMKGDMTNRGNSVTDTSPLVQIKHALKQLKLDIVSFDLQIGVVNHSLLQQKLRHGNLNGDTPGFKMRAKKSSSLHSKGAASHKKHTASSSKVEDEFDDDDDLFVD